MFSKITTTLTLIAALTFAVFTGLPGCEQEGSLEEAAEDVEEGAEEAKDETKDAVEEAGDAIEDATD